MSSYFKNKAVFFWVLTFVVFVAVCSRESSRLDALVVDLETEAQETEKDPTPRNETSKQEYQVADTAIDIPTPLANPKPDRDEWRKEEDLRAQQSMSHWTMGLFWVSGLGVVIGAFGLYFLKGTLDSTRGALRVTRLATAAAIDSNKLAEKYNYFQTRPFLSHSDISIKTIENTLRGTPAPTVFVIIELKVKNSGRTPANVEPLSFEIIEMPDFESTDQRSVFATAYCPAKQINSDDEVILTARAEIETQEWNTFLNSSRLIGLRGAVDYSAIFESELNHCMNFWYISTGGAILEGLGFELGAGGNTAT